MAFSTLFEKQQEKQLLVCDSTLVYLYFIDHCSLLLRSNDAPFCNEKTKTQQQKTSTDIRSQVPHGESNTSQRAFGQGAYLPTNFWNIGLQEVQR